MSRLLFALVTVFVFAVPALSDTDKETYVEGDTLWERTTVWYWYQPYCCNGYWAQRYEYRKVTSAKDPDWRAVLAKYAGKIRLRNEEHLAFIESVRALGLEGAGASIYTHQSAVVPQGQTVYGYSYNSVTDVYGIDLNVLYQQAARLVQNAQDYTAQAHAGHTTLVDRAGDRAARAAEILAKAQLIKAADTPQVRTETREFKFRIGPDGKVEENLAVATTIPSNKCMKCHSGAKLEGKFDVTAFHKLDQDGKERVWKKILNGEMPPKEEPQLTANERKAFFQ